MKHKVGSLDPGASPGISTNKTSGGCIQFRQATEVMWRISQAMTVKMQLKITANDDNFAHGDFALAA